MSVDSVLPTHRNCVRHAAGQRRAHIDSHLARGLYRRLCQRTIVLTRPVPQGIRQLLAEWVHQDSLVLACTTYVSGNGRRFRCHAQAFTPEAWWRSGQASWACVPVPFMRVVNTQVLWPAPLGPRQLWPDLPF